MSARRLAEDVRRAFEELSPLMEMDTSEICPHCESVCCIDRHGNHDPADLRLLSLLAEVDGTDLAPAEPALEDDTLPCRYLGPTGCGLERWRRPYRCTWYFCAPLLERLRNTEGRQYRAFVKALARLGALRAELMGAE